MVSTFLRRLLAFGVLPAICGLTIGCGEAASVARPDSTSTNASGTLPDENGSDRSPDDVEVGLGPASIRDEISVATWNIQSFGRAKVGRPHVMQVIVDIVRRFDVIAIQEVRSKDQSVIQEFLAMVNQDGYEYGIVIGPRVGRTRSTEQYLYLYDKSRIELLEDSVYTINDPRDLLHREPLVAGFRVIGSLARRPWTFTLVNIHTDPGRGRR